MKLHGTDSIAVIFRSERTGTDKDGYDKAAELMSTLAAQQPGYLGQDSVYSADGNAITVSYWRDDDAAKAWRDHPDHKEIRDAGRDRWYVSYTLHVARIERSYDWQK